MGDHRGKNVQCFSCPISPITGHEAPIPAVSTVWLVGRGDGLTACPLPRPILSRILNNGDCGPDGSYPLDRSGTAQWLLSRGRLLILVLICIT